MTSTMSHCGNSREKVYFPKSSFWPMLSGYQAEKRTRAGICSRQTCRAYAEPISIDSAMLPFIAKEMAFCWTLVSQRRDLEGLRDIPGIPSCWARGQRG